MDALVLRTFEEPVSGSDNRAYLAKICGRGRSDGLWEGWIEFVPEGGAPMLRSPRETTQPNLRNLEGWAERLSTVYLEGSLDRTLKMQAPRVRVPPPRPEAPHFEGPAPNPLGTRTVAPDDAALNPFLYLRRGESELRRGLAELPPAELRTIVRAYDLDGDGTVDVDAATPEALRELIVRETRTRVG